MHLYIESSVELTTIIYFFFDLFQTKFQIEYLKINTALSLY